MKALVYYCRWQGAKLRLRGRDETAVSGQLVLNPFTEQEYTQDFHFALKTNILTLQMTDGSKTLQLDEMGVIMPTSDDVLQ